MKVYDLRYAGGVMLGILLVPKALEEDAYTQNWFKEFDLPPVEARELDSTQVMIGPKSLQEWEDEYYGSKEHNSEV
jgi:hypothetical protein